MKLLVLSILILLSLSCSRHEPAGEEDQYRQIQTDIDRKNYSEAEKQLNEILQKDPTNERARVILASVFVNKAGITLKDYFDLEKLSHLNLDEAKPLVNLKAFEKASFPNDSDFAKALQFLKQANSVAGKIKEIAEKFDKVTLVDDSGSENLRKALEQLEQIRNPENGNALYRGVIKLYYFKYLWKNGKLLQFGQNKFCSLEVTKLANRLSSIATFTLGMVQDVARGFPQSDPEFKQTLTSLDQNFKKAQATLKSLKNPGQSVKEITERFAEEQSVEGFRCDF